MRRGEKGRGRWARGGVGMVGLLMACSQAAAEDDALSRLILENRYEMTGSHDALSGSGLEFLLAEARDSEFVLIGENHLTDQIPRMTGRLVRELRPAGFDVLAVETGDASTRRMVDLLRRGGVPGFRDRVVSYPFTVPFFEQVPEAELLTLALEQGYEIWGLDQEFVGSGRYWFDRLVELAPSDRARELASEWREREGEGMRAFGDVGLEDVFLRAATEGDFRELRRAFAGADSAVEIVEDLVASSQIYQLWQTDNFENNRRRTDYMKRNLMGRLAGRTGGAGRPPRVLMKLGSFHTGRALSPVNQLDVGNLAHQLAFLRGGHSLHVWSTALVNRQPDGTVSDLATPGSAVEPLARHVGNGPWTVFDVRPLRSWFQSSRNREAHPALADAVYQHDLILITREFTRSRSLLDEAGG